MLEFPAVLGHEGAGIIRAIGSDVKDRSLKVGDSALLSFNHCGTCNSCTSNHPACCTSFEALNITGQRLSAKLSDERPVTNQFFGQSSFLKHSIVSQHSVIPCPDPSHLSIYAALGCGFQTGAGTILNSLKPSKEDSVLIIGAGTVGIAAIMAAKFLGLRQIVAVDVVESKLEKARELGATHTLNSANAADITSAIHGITSGGAKFVIECTGIPAVIEKILDYACCGGTAAIVGCPNPNFFLRIDTMKMLHENKTLKGICQGDSISTKVRLYISRVYF